MSVFSRNRRKRYRDFKKRLRNNGRADRELGKWKLIDIHEITHPVELGGEFDFWAHNGEDVFLLRVRKSEIEKITVCKSKGNESVIYLIAEINFEQLDNSFIKNILNEISRKGIPRYSYRAFQIDL